MTAETLAEHLQLLQDATVDDFDELLEDLLVQAWPSKRGQDNSARRAGGRRPRRGRARDGPLAVRARLPPARILPPARTDGTVRARTPHSAGPPEEVAVSAVPEDALAREVSEVTRTWWLVVLMGVVSVVAGIVVLAKPGDSLATLAVITGIFILVDGIAELATALFTRTEGRGLVAVLGVLSAIVGLLLIRHPIQGVTAVALLLGVWLVAAGVVRLVGAFEDPEHRGRRIVAAAVLGIAGVIIVASPHIGYATLALITGLGFIAYGLSLLVLGWSLRVVRELVEPDAPTRAPS